MKNNGLNFDVLWTLSKILLAQQCYTERVFVTDPFDVFFENVVCFTKVF